MDQFVTNFEVYEDSVDMMGIAKATLPDLSWLKQTVSGAGISGNIEAIVAGHVDAMTLTLNFRTTSTNSIKLSAPRRHNIDLRVSQQIEDAVANEIRIQKVKHVLVVIPKGDKGGSIAPASPTDGSGEYAVRYWATYIDGVKMREIDPMNCICYIAGIDYLAAERAALGK